MGTGLHFGVMKMFWNQIGVVVLQHCEMSLNVPFKMVNFMICEFHLKINK